MRSFRNEGSARRPYRGVTRARSARGWAHEPGERPHGLRRVRDAGVRAGVVGAVFAASGGCIVETNETITPPVVVQPARLIVRWTVNESADPNLCALGRVAAIDIAVSTTSGHVSGEFQAPCTAFATTISTLHPGEYVADAVLVDAAGRPRTTVIAIHPFSLIERWDLVIDVDFPAHSFLDSFEREMIRLASDRDPTATGIAAEGATGSAWSGDDEPEQSAAPSEPSSSPQTR